MKIVIDIPKEFEDHFNLDRFADSLERILEDMTFGDKLFTLSGLYEYETIVMFKKAFQNSKPLIQCKDCKHSEVLKYRDGSEIRTCILSARISIFEDDFCSRGERREDDDKKDKK